MEEVYNILACGILYFFGVVSPGPSLLMIIDNSLTIGKKQALATAIGVTIGIVLQVLVVFIFLGKIEKLTYFLYILKYISASFLLFIGSKILFNKNIDTKKNMIKSNNQVWNGILVETLNPLAFMFFISIFTPYAYNSSIYFKAICLIEFILIGLIVFTSVAFILDNVMIKKQLLKKLYIIQKISAVMFIIFAIKLLTRAINN